MEIRQVAFLNILRSALTDTPVQLPEGLTTEDWKALAQMAAAHHVQALFYEAVCTIPEARAELGQLAPLVRRQVIEQSFCTQQLLDVYSKLEIAGVAPIVVKGIVCRSLYPKPDHRPSSDEDLLTRDPAGCHGALISNGMECAAGEDDFERTYRHPDMPLRIELHRYLFDPTVPAYGRWNRFFADVFDRAETLEVHGCRLLTMAPTDHMLYLLLHAFKHFLHSGFGIRQVCDMVRYAAVYSHRIDWQYVLDCCREVRGHLFAAAVFRIGEKYLGLEPMLIPWDIVVDEKPLLQDLLQAGVFGGSSDSRKRSSNVTLAAAADQKQGKLANALFPPVSSLTSKYPYLKKRPWLLPWAWLCRLVTYRGGNSRQTLQIAHQRLELLRQYGVTEKSE